MNDEQLLRRQLAALLQKYESLEKLLEDLYSVLKSSGGRGIM